MIVFGAVITASRQPQVFFSVDAVPDAANIANAPVEGDPCGGALLHLARADLNASKPLHPFTMTMEDDATVLIFNATIFTADDRASARAPGLLFLTRAQWLRRPRSRPRPLPRRPAACLHRPQRAQTTPRRCSRSSACSQWSPPSLSRRSRGCSGGVCENDVCGVVGTETDLHRRTTRPDNPTLRTRPLSSQPTTDGPRRASGSSRHRAKSICLS